ncbi:MAG TPA: PLP-dependent aminotransferase family protein [Thermoanaerobaculia bacterium]|jgi:(S)-3,5-dihydroxyphenylglycine transaminase|nr:PLP-dependent aminotransferase family protein [Thermoanaerobaculia bacterium]
MDITLRSSLADPLLDVMNFLNEVVLRYPDAVSFAPGRPSERFFDVEGSLGRAAIWVESRAAASGASERAVWNDLGQYNKTNGIINDLIARQLAADEGIAALPESILVTTGCQEGMAILLLGLIDPAGDALLVSDPAYIGIPGLARIMGLTLIPIPTGERGLDPRAVAEGIAAARRMGRRPRALYDVPDFNNPLGTRMPVEARRELLALAREHGMLIWEDNPYGMFSYDGLPLPTLKALDEHGVVVYMGSFSKTLFPGLRLGYLVADQQVLLPGSRRVPLAAELSKIKSLTTVNTSTVVQAIAGGILLEAGGSLRPLVEEKLPFYRANRDRMLACLEAALGGAGGVLWNRPEGGFFLTVTLPFEFTDECLTACARDYGVIVCPLRFFALTPGRERQVRLSFSYVDEERIAEGIDRFARFVRERID